MNVYLTKKQKLMMNLLIDSAEDLIAKTRMSGDDIPEDFEETLMELKSKINGVKVAKNGAVFEPIEIDCLNTQDKLVVRAREDGRAVILESKDRTAHKNGHYFFHLGLENSIILTNYLIQYLDAWGIEYKAEDKSYHEEINVFADEVERSISIYDGKISYICYTDDENDDHWTFLTPHKAKYFVELMLGYINSCNNQAV